MNQLINLFDKLKKRSSPIPLFFTVFIFDSVFSLLTSFLVSLYDPKITEIPFLEEFSLAEIFTITVIIAPLVETFIFQYLIIEFLLRFKKIKVNIIIFVSALAFGLVHDYNFIYVLVMCITGFIYASYYLYLKIKEVKFPFLYICSLHALSNFLVFILNDVLNLS